MTSNNHHCSFLVFIIFVLLTTTPAIAYVGSDACLVCHSGQYEKWVESGHPYKLIAINGEAPSASFPSSSAFANDPIDPPVGTTWSDFSYVIGGYGWKMRWIQNDGFIYTPAMGQNQYNFENQTWSNYHAGETKPYDCGGCHTTGWVNSDDGDPSNNQGGLPGFLGTFFAGGVHCEQCHGEGDAHVSDPLNVDMEVDDTSFSCGKCHSRGGDNGITPGETIIEASGGFIKHHEQYDEWYNSPHNSAFGPGCNDCHNPHASVKFDATTPGEGVSTTVTCESCHVDGTHANIASTTHGYGATCTDCHMPDASKSAIANNIHNGDISTHLWTINTSVNGKVDMFTADGTAVALDGNNKGAITLDFACYGCHTDPSGNGGGGSTKTLAELSERASNIHGTLAYVEPDMVPAAVALTGAYPNPFNPQTKITFSVSQSQHVTIAVYDMEGLKVTQLSDQVYNVGEHTTDWNGKNLLGRNVASGMYLVNIRASKVSQSLKIQLIR
ncbi:MAG: multiheme c-type cytochrome [Candidatus Krumholzibacteria bacterium]|nr:multiheme c-type cytochrome [Candidatus Krumholzibacteria bacterium]